MRWTGLTIIVLVLVGTGYYFWPRIPISPIGRQKEASKLNLEQYDFDNLRKRGGMASRIEIGGELETINKARKEKFDFTTREISFESDGQKISGMINYWPEKSSLSKVIIMIRGYAEPVGYFVGSGTWKVADALAKEGYATISLDFLGYGNSDKESGDVLEARFSKVNQVMDLIESVKQLPWVDKDKIGIWAHSNGGQIALSVLETTGDKYPTVLWAPMTQTFPESVLSTIDEGSAINEIITEFQMHYDARRYAFENYYSWIKAPVLIQQGTADVWCKVEWQQIVVKAINGQLVVYEGADHNLKGSWQEAVDNDREWYNTKL